jgi:UDP-2-acetamido-2,6-beta-L-arabino-hexul-4-ose reductase
LIEHLKIDKEVELYLYSKRDSIALLEVYVKEADFIFHLAGVNRPENINEFYKGNSYLTKIIVDILVRTGSSTTLVLSSSAQSALDNDYGKSKLEAENMILEYSEKTQADVYIYRLPNVFGKWSKPNYNSVISTWCHNIANDVEIQVKNRDIKLSLVYVDDVVESFVKKLKNKSNDRYVEIDTVYKKTLGEIGELIYQFKENRRTLLIPNVASGFERALYSTYLSYLSVDNFSYILKGQQDNRGTFYEILKTLDSGQFSLSTTAPGIIRGNHYHHTKNEKFLVVKGKAVIEFRHIITNETINYNVSDRKMEVVEMIPGYTHNIKNIGVDEMVLFIWANENFDQDNPDTYFLEV